MSRLSIDEGDVLPVQPSFILLSARTLAKRLGLSVRTLWRLRSGGKLPPPVRLGGAVRWRAADIDAWVAAGCPDPSLGNRGGAT
jgi:excisionase family DNA binding protein